MNIPNDFIAEIYLFILNLVAIFVEFAKILMYGSVLGRNFCSLFLCIFISNSCYPSREYHWRSLAKVSEVHTRNGEMRKQSK